MPNIYWDVETYSECDLEERGAYIYATDKSTDVLLFCYAIDDGEVQVWMRGDPVPAVFANPAGHKFVSDNWDFERQILTHVLIPRYGFVPIPIEDQDCAQRLALANAYPAKLLNRRCEALGLPFREDKEARETMRRLSRPPPEKKPTKRKKPKLEDPAAIAAAREHDLVLLRARCENDVAATRAAYNSPLLKPLLPEERHMLLLDAEINARGICANVPFLHAVIALANKEHTAINARLNELTGGEITAVTQVGRIMKAVNARGHKMTTLGKRSVAATLARQPDDFTREVLTLRKEGAYTVGGTAKRLLAHASPDDHRIRGGLRIYSAGPGRWASPGPQLHGLNRNDAELPAHLVDALLAGNYAELARFGDPLKVVANIMRAGLCAAPGHELICADFGAIESRILAWLANEAWKLKAFHEYDTTHDERLHVYRQTAAQMLRISIENVHQTERQVGKCGELACGFGGSKGAWRRIANDTDTPDAVLLGYIKKWRAAHPATLKFWRLLARAARAAIRTKNPQLVAPAPLPPIVAAYDGQALTLTLPSGRAINYPDAKIVANKKFEDGDPDIEYLDNAKGKWAPTRAWFGTLVENCVQGTARDLLRDAIIRAEAHGWKVVFHCHDELVIEAPEGTLSEQDMLALLLEPPAWATSLPLGGKVHSGPLYLEAPATGEPPPITSARVEMAGETLDDRAQPPQEAPKSANDFDNTPESTPDDDIIATLDERAEEQPTAPPWEGESAFTAASEPPHICAHCHRDPPDGTERASAYNDAYLHPQCVEPFTRARMADAGLDWQSASFVQPEPKPATPTPPPPPPPPPPKPAPSPRSPRSGNGRAGSYPFGGHKRGHKVAEFIYLDQNRAPYQRVDKYEWVSARGREKSYPQYYMEDGEWVPGAPDPVILYRLPELLATPADVLVLICEGEKDCLTAARYGFVATCNPGGAKVWQAELAQYFQGQQQVCVVEDHDSDGERHTELVVNALRNVVPTIGVLRFPELPPKGDLTDFFERGGTKAGLLLRIEEALKAGIPHPYIVHKLGIETVTTQRWLWRNHLPIGALELNAGKVGIGKGLLLCDLIARITTGRAWPDGSPGSEPGSVIILTAEDRAEDYVRRLAAAGADRNKAYVLEYVRRNGRDELFLLAEDLDKLEQACRDIGDTRLVAFDPITAYMGSGRGFDSHRASDVRAQLHPLKASAERLDIAFTAITHPPKGANGRAVLDSFIGSQAFIAAARVAHFCVEELDEEDRSGYRRPTGRVFYTVPKYSHSEPVPTLIYRKEVVQVGTITATGEPITAPRIVWEGSIRLSADEAVDANKPTARDGRKARAAPVREFLRDILANGPMLRETVIEHGIAEGFSPDQLRRAREAIGAVSFRCQDEGRRSQYMWCLPQDAPTDAEVGGD
jgi:DNA polymerase